MIRDTIREQILSILQTGGSKSVKELSSVTFSSESTIRRAIQYLEDKGDVVCVRGIVSLIRDISVDRTMPHRYASNVRQKQKIARAAQRFIENGERIMIDSSSTSLIFAESLKNYKHMDVLTNGIVAALELAQYMDPTTRVFCTGGIVYREAAGTYGSSAIEGIRSHHVDRAFVSGRGLDPRLGLTDSREEESSIKRAMSDCANETIVLLDSSKFLKQFYTQSLPLDAIDTIVTDAEPPQEIREVLEQTGTSLIIAE